MHMPRQNTTIGIVTDGSEKNRVVVKRLLKYFNQHKNTVYLNRPMYELIKDEVTTELNMFDINQDHDTPLGLILSVGGDGTVLRSIQYALKLDIPLLGLNTGRLGFLSNNMDIDFEAMCKKLSQGMYRVSRRSVIEVQINDPVRPRTLYGLNEVSIMRRETTAMITVDVHADTRFVNNYWGDGLVISTSTGSTGYNLSCSGPIVDADLQNLMILTPIAPHNLNLRPLIVSGDKVIHTKTSSRTNDYLVTVDTELEHLSENIRLQIKLADQKLKVAFFSGFNFWNTLIEKLNWGYDKRNQA